MPVKVEIGIDELMALIKDHVKIELIKEYLGEDNYIPTGILKMLVGYSEEVKKDDVI